MRARDLNWDFSAFLFFCRSMVYFAITFAGLSALRYLTEHGLDYFSADYYDYVSWVFLPLLAPYALILPAAAAAYFRESPVKARAFQTPKDMALKAYLFVFIGLWLIFNLANPALISFLSKIDAADLPDYYKISIPIFAGLMWAVVMYAATSRWLWPALPHWSGIQIAGGITFAIILAVGGYRQSDIAVWFYPFNFESMVIEEQIIRYVKFANILASYVIAFLAIMPYSIALSMLHGGDTERRHWGDKIAPDDKEVPIIMGSADVEITIDDEGAVKEG